MPPGLSVMVLKEKISFLEEGGLLRAWDETLSFLKTNRLLDNVIYVDLLNEYPNWHGYDWFKNEMNTRSDIKKFKLENPEANVPEPGTLSKNGIHFSRNSIMNF